MASPQHAFQQVPSLIGESGFLNLIKDDGKLGSPCNVQGAKYLPLLQVY
jgi:hypothetical protein